MTSILFRIVRNFSSLFKLNYLKNEKRFLNFLSHLCDLHQILSIFEKKIIVIANVFPKLQTVKHLVKQLSRKHRSRISFDSQGVNGCQTLVKSSWEHFYDIFWSLWGEMICKYVVHSNLKSEVCLLTHWLPMTSILFRIVRICCSLLTCNYLINQKFFWIFSSIYEISSNFKHFRKKDDRDT